MIARDMMVNVKDGLNVGTVALFIQEASQFDSSIYLEYGSKKVNAKSIMGMMTLNIAAGENILVTADIKGIEDALQTAYPEWSVRRDASKVAPPQHSTE